MSWRELVNQEESVPSSLPGDGLVIELQGKSAVLAFGSFVGWRFGVEIERIE